MTKTKSSPAKQSKPRLTLRQKLGRVQVARAAQASGIVHNRVTTIKLEPDVLIGKGTPAQSTPKATLAPRAIFLAKTLDPLVPVSASPIEAAHSLLEHLSSPKHLRAAYFSLALVDCICEKNLLPGYSSTVIAFTAILIASQAHNERLIIDIPEQEKPNVLLKIPAYNALWLQRDHLADLFKAYGQSLEGWAGPVKWDGSPHRQLIREDEIARGVREAPQVDEK